jgi:DNA-binding MarR family transcriptional regulator
MTYAKNVPVDTRPRTDAGLASALAMSVSRLSRRLRQERRTDLTATQLSALGTIRRHGPLTVGALAAYERVQPPSITRTVNCLGEMGLLRRESSASDGRQVVLHLSARGEELLAAERRRRDAWLAQRLRELDPADKEVLRRATALLEGLAQA